MTLSCHECPEDDRYEGDIKGLCSHVGKGHEMTWGEYKETYDIDDAELRERNRRNARSGWRYKKRQERD